MLEAPSTKICYHGDVGAGSVVVEFSNFHVASLDWSGRVGCDGSMSVSYLLLD